MAAPAELDPVKQAPASWLRLAWFSLFMAAVFALLIGLGVWQLQRLEWKRGLMQAIHERSEGSPVPLGEALRRVRAGKDIEYLRVTLTGRFEHDKERHLFAVSDGEPGWHVITPMRTEAGPVVLVDRGFVPNDLKQPAARPEGEVEGEVTRVGLVRMPQPQGFFTPDNEIAENKWFWRDLAGMSASIYPKKPPEIAPFFVEAVESGNPGGWPKGGQTRLSLPNNHLQYAWTWFTMAAVLAIVYAAYIWSVVRPRPAPPESGDLPPGRT